MICRLRLRIVQPGGKFSYRKKTAGGRFHLICDRALKDDFRPGVIGDFQEAGSQGVSAAKGNVCAIECFRRRIGPFHVGHAGDLADKLCLRPDDR